MEAEIKLEVVSNNPRLEADSAPGLGVVFIHKVDGSPVDVIERAEELLQDGRKLVSAPLPPNIPLMRAPYRSIVLDRNDRKYDADGILSLSKAHERLVTQRAIDEEGGPGRSEDFAMIDEDLLRRAIRDYRLIIGAEV